MSFKVALPKGRLMEDTAAVLTDAEWGFDGYHAKARFYRLKSKKYPDVEAKIFHEKDIPIQVAVGNYDIGICGLDWVEELVSKYPNSEVINLYNLGYGKGALYAASAADINQVEEIGSNGQTVRIASEYPNLAEALAEKLRLKHFVIYPLWGAAEAYPPENAELILLPRKTPQELLERGLKPLFKMLDFRACLIANKKSLKNKDMGRLVSSIIDNLPPAEEDSASEITDEQPSKVEVWNLKDNELKMALPDGHQQPHVRKLFAAAGIEMTDYPSETGNRRPKSPSLSDVAFKLIRPQDMPLQVANGNFDIAITGRDWLTDHLYKFPSSPVEELLDLKYGWVRIVAVVDNDVPIESVADYKEYYKGKNVRIATEYTNIADYYARNNHMVKYRIVPTWGATEAFIPEDADIMVENTETGGTIKRHNLKIVDTIFESTACIIANKESKKNKVKKAEMDKIVKLMGKALEEGQ
jgi:ATP phosphoribosyltransferase